MKPTLIKQMGFVEYLNDPAPEPSLTSGLVRDLLSTAPRKVWHKTPRLNPKAQPEQKTIFDLGTVAHALFTGEGEPIEVIDAKAFNTNAAKEARDAAYAAGKTPILIDKLPQVQAMAREAQAQFAENHDIGHLFADPGLLREATIIWVEDGVYHRCRPDFYHPGENIIIHYKTTGNSIGPGDFDRYATNSGWYLTASHYGAGAKALTGELPRQYFAVQETDEPHLCRVAEMDNTALANGDMRRERAMTIWGRCLSSNNWPGYANHTHKITLPEWEERKLIEAKDAENEGPDFMEVGLHWQAPENWEAK